MDSRPCLALPRIGRDLKAADLPPRLFYGRLNASIANRRRYRQLRDAESNLSAIIEQSHYKAASRDYLANANLAAFAQERWHKRDGQYLIGGPCLTVKEGMELLEDFVARQFPLGRGRPYFARDLFATIQPMLVGEECPVDLLLLHKPAGHGLLHVDLRTRRRGIMTLPTPDALGTWLDVSATGLGFYGQELSREGKPCARPEDHRQQLAEVAPGDLCIASGQLSPHHKWSTHAEPTIPANHAGRTVAILNFKP